ncbi:MAG: hypothetical protein R3F19_35370 [Verrucomicrobiales bacterium]
MQIIFYIGYLVFFLFGIFTLVRGKVALSEKRFIYGARARLIGLIAALTYPISWVVGFCYTFYRKQKEADFGLNDISFPAAMSIYLSGFISVALVIAIIVLAGGSKENIERTSASTSDLEAK